MILQGDTTCLVSHSYYISHNFCLWLANSPHSKEVLTTSEDWPLGSARIMGKIGEKGEKLGRAGQEGAGIK